MAAWDSATCCRGSPFLTSLAAKSCATGGLRDLRFASLFLDRGSRLSQAHLPRKKSPAIIGGEVPSEPPGRSRFASSAAVRVMALDLLHPLDQRLGLHVEFLPPFQEGVAEVAVVFLGDLLVVLHPLELVLDPRLLVEEFLQCGHVPRPFGCYQTSPAFSASPRSAARRGRAGDTAASAIPQGFAARRLRLPHPGEVPLLQVQVSGSGSSSTVPGVTCGRRPARRPSRRGTGRAELLQPQLGAGDPQVPAPRRCLSRGAAPGTSGRSAGERLAGDRAVADVLQQLVRRRGVGYRVRVSSPRASARMSTGTPIGMAEPLARGALQGHPVIVDDLDLAEPAAGPGDVGDRPC